MSAPDHSDEPVAGTYMGRLARRGPYVPIKLEICAERDEDGTLIEDEKMRAFVDGEEVPLPSVWPWCGKNPITLAEYEYMRADARHARDHRPGDPKANPRKAIDFARDF